MTDQLPIRPYPRPTAQVEPYVEVFGFDLAIAFLLQFGGANMMVSKNPRGRSQLEALVGYDKAKALSNIDHKLQRRVPLAKAWLAKCLKVRGLSVSAIARTLRVTDISVRGWLRDP